MSFIEAEMGKRGPKPVNMGELDVWEDEWCQALHLLRDGVELRPAPAFARLNRREATAQLKKCKKAKPHEILRNILRVNPPAFSELPTTEERVRAKREWMEQEQRRLRELFELMRKAKIDRLKQQLNPKEIYARAERREIWDTLIRAQTVPAVQKACQRWESLADVRGRGFSCFVAYVSTNAKEFLRMKKKQNRFPQSSYADESRLEHLARGMAGVMMGVSPMTAIERLRNMKHGSSGPLWSKSEKRCNCWRCRLNCSHRLYESLEKQSIEEGVGQ